MKDILIKLTVGSVVFTIIMSVAAGIAHVSFYSEEYEHILRPIGIIGMISMLVGMVWGLGDMVVESFKVKR